MKRKLFISMLSALLCCLFSLAGADRIPEEKPDNYLGAMRVVWCDEWVSLREEPSKLSYRLDKIPLGDIVYSCKDIGHWLFYECEYHGQKGYVLKGYLVPAPEYEPPVSSAVTRKMTMNELTGNGTLVMEWKDFNMTIAAAREYITENKKGWEVLRLGCFINGEPIWGHEERVEQFSQFDMLKVFIGGVEDDWQVILYDGGYGLSLLDLMSGKEKWTLPVADCPLGNAAAYAADANGTMYFAGTDGPDPVAVSMDGQVLWQSEISDPEVFDPFEISIRNSTVQVKYRSGMESGYKLVTLDNTGDLLSVETVQTEE